MKKQQGVADKEDGNETTPIYIVYVATICKT